MTELTSIRVGVADDHENLRDSLTFFLETFDDLEYVGQASDGRQAVALCKALQPDVILLDMVMPGMSGVQTIRTIQQTCPQVKVIALTNFYQQAQRQKALQAGAFACLPKDTAIDKLAQVIRAAGRDQVEQTN